tara:strand:- start:32114 stop:33403 length:1290 start_codon:yes stop_codon:yes gene_type:complete
MKIEVNISSVQTPVQTSYSIDMTQRKYSDVHIYVAKDKNGKPSVAPGKQWHVWFLWENPDTGKRDIKKMYKRGVNRYKTVKERKIACESLKKALENLLDRGWNPQDKKIEKSNRSNYTLREGVNYALQLKTGNAKESTAKDYEFRTKVFSEWADKNGKSGLPLQKFGIDDFYQFMDYLELDYKNKKTGKRLSNTSIDNTKRVISALFSELKKKRLITNNFIKDIPKLKAEPLKNRPFSHSQIVKIKQYLEKEDPYLIPFIAFLMYPLLRPIEVTRLRVKDLNTEDWILGVETKTEAFSYRKIIKKLQPVVEKMNIENCPGSYYLFTLHDRPGEWETKKEASKVTHFSNRFKKVKAALGFGEEYGLYSFRHTSIGDLYNEFQKKGLSEQEIIFKLMPITRHKSEGGLRNYLRNIKIALPADHSDIYSIDF